MQNKKTLKPSQVAIEENRVKLIGDLTVFPRMKALIVFAHGSGSSRLSPRNRRVARDLNDRGFGTLLFDLLTVEEAENRENVFDIELLADRLAEATRWVRRQEKLKTIPLGFFGASTGAAAALLAESQLKEGDKVYAIVSRGGRPDLADRVLTSIETPTLLIVGEYDDVVIELNRQAEKKLKNSLLEIVPKATHLFEEPGALTEVARHASTWFTRFLPGTHAEVMEPNLAFNV